MSIELATIDMAAPDDIDGLTGALDALGPIRRLAVLAKLEAQPGREDESRRVVVNGDHVIGVRRDHVSVSRAAALDHQPQHLLRRQQAKRQTEEFCVRHWRRMRTRRRLLPVIDKVHRANARLCCRRRWPAASH